MLTSITLPVTRGSDFTLRYAERREHNIHTRHTTRDWTECREADYLLHGMDLRGEVVQEFGAGVGVFSCVAAAQGAVRVTAVEPDESKFAALRYNALNSDAGVRVNPLRAALSVRASKNADVRWRVDEMLTRQRMNTITVDTLAHEYPSIIKMAVQGAEDDWLAPPPSSVRVFWLKTRELDYLALARYDRMMRGLTRIRLGQQLLGCRGYWYEWKLTW